MDFFTFTTRHNPLTALILFELIAVEEVDIYEKKNERMLCVNIMYIARSAFHIVLGVATPSRRLITANTIPPLRRRCRSLQITIPRSPEGSYEMTSRDDLRLLMIKI